MIATKCHKVDTKKPNLCTVKVSYKNMIVRKTTVSIQWFHFHIACLT